MPWLLLTALAVLGAYTSVSPAHDADDRGGSDAVQGAVTRVIDGDTFRMAGQPASIRVWGLDAPEAGSPGGAAATAAITRLIAGQVLTCRRQDVDRYGRLVGQCFLPDGRDLARAMIAARVAREYCRYSGNHYGTC